MFIYIYEEKNEKIVYNYQLYILVTLHTCTI